MKGNGEAKSSQFHHRDDFVEQAKALPRLVQSGSFEHLLTIKELCQWLAISDSSARRLIRNGEIPITRVGGSIRFEPENVRRYIRRQTQRVTE